MKKFNIGLAGYGTVGTSVVNIIESKKQYFKEVLNVEICIKKILVKSAKNRTVPPNSKIVYDKYLLINDDTLDCIIAVMGGNTFAKDFIIQCLEKNIPVVTANKKFICENLSYLYNTLSNDNTSQFGYEAAVCGGIPIINSLKHDYVSDRITECKGIFNGTTNFILSNMEKDKIPYDIILKEAQDNGYAEADPTADVDGYDALDKLVIMIQLTFGKILNKDDIPIQGIRRILLQDFEYAKSLDSTIKLLGVVRNVDDKLEAFVSPVLVKKQNIISSVNQANNIVNITSENLGNTYYIGKGAGGYPTANSVVNDVISIIKKESPCSTALGERKCNIKFNQNYSSQFYLRLKIKDTIGIIGNIGNLCKKKNISIYSILQNPIVDKNNCIFVIITDTTCLMDINLLVKDLQQYDWCLDEPFFMPIV